MPFINLIQEQRILAKRSENLSRASFVGLISMSSAIVLLWGGLTFAVDKARNEQARLRNEIQRQAPILSEITLNTKEAAILEPKVKTLEEGQKLTDKWSNILGHLAVQTPKDAWLTAIRSTNQDEESPTTISFLGMSPGQELVSEFIRRLQNAKDLDAVNIKYTHPKEWNGKSLVEFEITAQVKGTAHPKPPAKPEGQKS